MPEEPNQLISYNNFSGGDYGSLGGRKAPPNTFSAKNMLVYADGSLGPRPGLRDVTPTSMPTGELLGLSATYVPGSDGIFIIGDDVYKFDLNTPATSPTNIGSFAVTPDQPVQMVKTTADLWVTVRQDSSTPDKTYRIDPGGSAVFGITDSPGGHVVAQRGQQLVVAESQFSPRILASSAVDPEDWSAGTFIDVGDDWQVTGLHEVKNSLVVTKYRGGWFVISGIIGDADTEIVRRAVYAGGVLHPWQVARDNDERLWFSHNDTTLAFFNGTSISLVGHIKLGRELDDTTADPPLKRSIVCLDGDQTRSTVVAIAAGNTQEMAIQHNGAWTKHAFEIDVSAMAAENGDQLVLTDGGTTMSAASIYVTQFDIDRPPATNDTLVGPGDDSNTPLDQYVYMPEYWESGGRAVQVKQIIVDFTSYNTGTTETAHFDVNVEVLGRSRADDILYTHGTPFDEAVGLSDAGGTRRRREFNFHCNPGAGFQVSLTNVRNCKIHEITVMDAPRPGRPVVR